MPQIHYLPDEQVAPARADETILQVSLRAGIPHAHACGGQARCSTCRVWILEGLEHCTPRNEYEQALARRLRLDAHVRLACQTTVQGDLKLRRLVLDDEDLALTNQLERPAGATEGHEQQLAIMFADLRGFTAFSEPLPPYDVIYVLNRFFHQMGEVISRHGGAINNYMGDGLMALFGVDEPEDAPVRAAAAALEMLEAMEALKPHLAATYGQSLEIGIGIHYGPAVVGTVGYGDSRKLSAIGDSVNFASRIESANKTAGTRLLVSEEMYLLVRDRVVVGRTARVDVKGKAGLHTLFELVGLQAAAHDGAAEVAGAAATFGEDGRRWLRALPVAEIPPGARRMVKLHGQSVLVLNHEGELFAIESRCPHLRLPLQRARLTADGAIVCPWHHSAFDLTSGDVESWAPWPPVVGPALGVLRRQRALATWPVRVEGGYVWVAVDGQPETSAAAPA